MAETLQYTLSLIDKISGPMRKITTSSSEVEDKISKLTSAQEKSKAINEHLGGSIASLRSRMNMLREERELISPRNHDNIKKYNDEISKLEAEIRKLDNLGSGVNPLSRLNLTAIIQQTQYTAQAVAEASSPFISFDQSLADLSAITGIAGKDLEYLGTIARKTGADSGLGAVQGTEAFKLLASQIDVSKIGIEGLVELQKKTITLAQASGMAMGDSANALAGTINQFGLSADQASRVINVLAAGSKYGAAEIPELAQSFKVVGAAANAAGLSVESTAGAIEVLSKNNLKGAEAGTALRNIVLKMQTALGYDFTKTSLSDALDSLKPKLNDATFLSKTFGIENIAAAQFLISNAEAVDEMTQRVTGSNVAMEQAALRTDTVQAMMERCRAKIEDLKIGFFSLFGSAAGYITIAGEQAVMISQLVPLILLFGNSMKWLTNIENIKSTASKIATGATKLWTAAQWALNSAFIASPLGWIVVGISAVVAAVTICWKKFEGFREVVLGTWAVIKEFGKTLFDSIVNPFKQILKGIGGVCSAIGKLFKGEFKEAAAEAKAGFADLGEGMIKANPIGVVYNTVKNGDYQKAWQQGKQDGRDSWAKSQLKAKESNENIITPEALATPSTIEPSVNFDELMQKVGKNKNTKAKSNILDLNDTTQNLAESATYSSITKKTTPSIVNFAPVVTSAQDKIDNVSSVNKATNANRIDDGKQEYAPKKEYYLLDIMHNVRRIAAAIVLPAVFTLTTQEVKATSTPADIPTSVVNIPDVQVPQPPTVIIPVPADIPASVVNIPDVQVPQPPTVNIPVPADIPAPSDAYAMPSEKISEKSNYVSETTTIQDSGKNISIDKICDQIVIHIQNTDNKGIETIREEIMKVLNELGDE